VVHFAQECTTLKKNAT
jgi:hypothetical protein